MICLIYNVCKLNMFKVFLVVVKIIKECRCKLDVILKCIVDKIKK